MAEFEKASAIDEATLPPDNPQLAQNYMSIGVVLLELDRKDEARQQQERALAMFEKEPEDNEQAIEITLLNLARTYQALDRTADALKAYNRALTNATKRRGPDDLSIADISMNMAESEEAAGDHKKAISLFEDALRIRTAKLGPNHPDTARAIGAFGENAFARKDWPEVIRRFDAAIAILEKNDETPLIAELLTMRGKAHAALGHKAQADADAKRAAELTKNK